MTALNMMTRGNCFNENLEMVELKKDFHSVLQQVRVLRLELGSVLDQLESFEPGPEALEKLLSQTENIAMEVDSLNDIVRQLMGK
jgi:hypothetical protein